MSNLPSPPHDGHVFDPNTTVGRSPVMFTVSLDGDGPAVAASPTMFTVAVGRPGRTVPRSAPRTPLHDTVSAPVRARTRRAAPVGCGRESRTAMMRRHAATVDWFAAAA